MVLSKPDLKGLKCPSCEAALRLLWEAEDLYICPMQSVLWKYIVETNGYLLRKIYSPPDYQGPEQYSKKLRETGPEFEG